MLRTLYRTFDGHCIDLNVVIEVMFEANGKDL